MKSRIFTLCLFFWYLFIFYLFSLPLNSEYKSVQAQGLNQRIDQMAARGQNDIDSFGSSSDLKSDSADVAIAYGTAYPGHSSGIEVKMKNPASIAGFSFEITIDPPELADFSTVRVYVDSMDTCPAPEETCWYHFPIRECLIEPAPAISGWSFLEAHGMVGDTSQPECETVWVLGLAIFGDPVPPDPNYQSLFRLGVDISCVSDSLTYRTVGFSITGDLSDPYGQPVPLRTHSGELAIWWSVPGDVNNDSLVNVGDVVSLLNYLYRNGSDPCVMEAADPNADCKADVGDVVYLINYLFREGSPPSPGCAH
jgi:hypothetical protein